MTNIYKYCKPVISLWRIRAASLAIQTKAVRYLVFGLKSESDLHFSCCHAFIGCQMALLLLLSLGNCPDRSLKTTTCRVSRRGIHEDFLRSITSFTKNFILGASFLCLLSLSKDANVASNLALLFAEASSFLPALVSSSQRACNYSLIVCLNCNCCPSAYSSWNTSLYNQQTISRFHGYANTRPMTCSF